MNNKKKLGWDKFGEAMDLVGESVSEIVVSAFKSGRVSGSQTTVSMGDSLNIVTENGKVSIDGCISSLRINGRLIRLPSEVMKGK